MRRLRIFEHISLDGVIQHSADEGDFPYGNWTAPYRSAEGREAVQAAQGERFDLLLGRRTYDIWSGYWPKAPSGPLSDPINAATKYVATHRPESLAWGPVDQLQWGVSERPVDFFDVKGDVEQLLAPRAVSFVAAEHPAMHPGRCAAIVVDGKTIGHVGEFHPRWRQAYELPSAPVVFELDLAAVQAREVPQAQALPRQQAARRDLALVVHEHVKHDALTAALRDDATGLVRSATLFDVYRPKADAADFAPGERSLAVRLELLSDDATLTDEIIDAAVAAAIARATAAVGARLRA